MTQKIKILIGNDYLEEGRTWADAFRANGMESITLPSRGKLILSSTLNYPPDVLIIEAKMPEMNAISLLKELNDFNCKPIVIVISNYDSSCLESKILSAGADYLIVKPFSTKTLVERVEKVLRQHHTTHA
ncbi:MAG: response regulator [Eubacterium sp.]|jgi:two-component system response regulator (stage 0 sporulation protein A)|nr:response regulator [Eubacterium sp.]